MTTKGPPRFRKTLPADDTPAKRCDSNVCKLPNCFCGGNQLLPGMPWIYFRPDDDAVP